MCEVSPSTDHAIKGTGHLCKAAGTSLAIVAVAAMVANIGIVLLVKDGYFFYIYVNTSAVTLSWLIPVTLASFTINVMVISNAANFGYSLIKSLAKKTKESGDKMLMHYRAKEVVV